MPVSGLRSPGSAADQPRRGVFEHQRYVTTSPIDAGCGVQIPGADLPGWDERPSPDKTFPVEELVLQQPPARSTGPPTFKGRVFEGRIVPYFGQDASCTLDRTGALDPSDPEGILTERLDLERAGLRIPLLIPTSE